MEDNKSQVPAPSCFRPALAAAIVFGGALCYGYFGFYKMLFSHFHLVGGDFFHGYAAAQNFMAGRPVYESLNQAAAQAYYLPAVFTLFLPFCGLSPDKARAVWFALTHVLIIFSLLTVYRYGRGVRKLYSAAAAAAVILCSMLLYSGLLTGNLSMLIFAALCLSCGLLLAGRRGAVPAIFAVFAAIKIFPALLMLPFFRQKAWPACRRFALVLAGILGASVIFFGGQNNLDFAGNLFAITDYAGVLYNMSFQFLVKMYFPGVSRLTLILLHAALLVLLLARLFKKAAPYTGGPGDRAVALLDLSAATAIMIMVLPSAWTVYGVFFAPLFYFVLLSFLEGGQKFKRAWVFFAVFFLISFWEIIYYQLPVLPGGITLRAIELNKIAYPRLYPPLFSLHFIALAALFWWITDNYRELGDSIVRLAGLRVGPGEMAA